MRTVVNNSEVYHLWAHQSQDHARGKGSVSFREKDAYSYNTVIGRIIEREGKHRVYVVDTSRHSSTTSKHQSYLRSAIPSDAETWYVEGIPGASNRFSRGYGTLDGKPQDYLYATLDRLSRKMDEAIRATLNKRWLLREIEERLKQAERIVDYFDIEKPAPPPELVEKYPALVASVKKTADRISKLPERQVSEYESLLTTIEAIEQLASLLGLETPTEEAFGITREKIEERMENTEAVEAEQAERLGAAAIERENKRREASERRAEEEIADYADKLARWLRGENVSIPYYTGRHIEDRAHRMRLKGDTVETTLGAKVPAADVCRWRKKVLRLIEWAQAQKKDVMFGEGNVPEVKFGNYKVNRVTAQGTLIVGCHRFSPEEIHRFNAILDNYCGPESEE